MIAKVSSMSNTDTNEHAVRSYLVALQDPSKLVDETEIGRLEAAVAAAADPIDKLLAITALERHRTVDLDSYEQAFIRHAKKWATDHNVPPASFRQLGVKDRVLAAAGLATTTKTGGRRNTRHSRDGAAATSTVTADQVKQHIATRTGAFTLIDLADSTGASPMTLRKAIGQMIDNHQLARIGTDPNHQARGRAPVRYQRP